MLPLDDAELYDLSEAGRRLFQDPARLARRARQREIPAVWTDRGLAVPRAWVEAESGRVAADAEGIKRYWLERLAPPATEARRALKDRRDLPVESLDPPAETARRLWMDARRLRRLDGERTLPALRVDGETCYDAELARRLGEAYDAGRAEAADRRRAEVAAWTAFEYVTDLDGGAEPPPTTTRAAPAQAVASAPRAWHLPEDLVEPGADEPREPEPPPDDADGSGKARLIDAEGFETLDEDP